jgi:hypothetical protein
VITTAKHPAGRTSPTGAFANCGGKHDNLTRCAQITKARSAQNLKSEIISAFAAQKRGVLRADDHWRAARDSIWEGRFFGLDVSLSTCAQIEDLPDLLR